jgi:hypothetical protein
MTWRGECDDGDRVNPASLLLITTPSSVSLCFYNLEPIAVSLPALGDCDMWARYHSHTIYIYGSTTGYSWTDLRTESQCGNRNWSVIFLSILQRNVNGIEKHITIGHIKGKGEGEQANPRGCCTPTRFSDGQWSVCSTDPTFDSGCLLVSGSSMPCAHAPASAQHAFVQNVRCVAGRFSSKKFCKRTVDSPSHRIFGRMHEALNIDKK